LPPRPTLPSWHSRLALVLTAGLLCAGPARAQEPVVGLEGDGSSGTRLLPVLRAAPRTGEIRIDGRIDEPAWARAPVATNFVQAEPDEGTPATRETEVRFLIDDRAIYVAARMWDEDPASIGRHILRRDDRGPYFDWFAVSLDPNLDRRTAYTFQVSAAGVQADRFAYDDQYEDNTWDAVWESAVAIDSLGWTVEIRIPLSQIRYNSSEAPQTWGVNFTRRRPASHEMSHFAFMSRRREEGQVSRYALLEDVIVTSPVRRVEARPYLVSSFLNAPAEPGNPFFDGSSLGVRAGSDFRLGLGSSFTLDATINPDFGQVEADPAEINLTAFESFFGERRPFFVEDAKIFDFGLSGGQNQLFYTRRVGRTPRGTAPEGASFSDRPDATTILGAAKLTGRTSSGLALGALAALTSAEMGQAFFLEEERTEEFGAEPRTLFGAMALQQDMNEGASQLQGIATVLRRSLVADGPLGWIPDQAYSAGIRFEHQWNDRGWRLNGFLAGSNVYGSPEAMVRLQRSSSHYFQRPDATRSQIDSTATSMEGAEWRIQLDRQNTLHWTGSVWIAQVTPGFAVNDMGFSGSRERLDGGVRLGYREVRPGQRFRDYSVNLRTYHNFSHEALDDVSSWTSWREAYTSGTFDLDARATFLNFRSANLNLSWQPDQYSRTATRGGPVMIQPGGAGFRAGFDTDRRESVVLNSDVAYFRNTLGGGDNLSIRTSVDVRPSSRLAAGIQPQLEIQSDGAQYVTQTSTPSYAPTFGRRYLFGTLERTTLSLQARANYVLSTTLSFQMFAQPLLSSGRYVRYRQLTVPGSYDFLDFQQGTAVPDGGTVLCVGGNTCRSAEGTRHMDLDGDGVPDFHFPDADFNVRSLVGNAVVRWEYRPGSTVFLVWQRQQRHSANDGTFALGRDLSELWTAPAENRFIVKANYWLGL